MKKALLIGINDYPEGNELTGCIEDINSVKAAIERHGDGSPNFGVKMMPNVQTMLFVNFLQEMMILLSFIFLGMAI